MTMYASAQDREAVGPRIERRVMAHCNEGATMQDLTEFQQRACAVAVVKMLGGKHFSVCDLDAIAKTMGRESALAGRDYAALRSVHCVDWADMGPELAQLTREKCLELLGLPPQTIEMLKPEQPREKPTEPAKRLRLAFWRAA